MGFHRCPQQEEPSVIREVLSGGNLRAEVQCLPAKYGNTAVRDQCPAAVEQREALAYLNS